MAAILKSRLTQLIARGIGLLLLWYAGKLGQELGPDTAATVNEVSAGLAGVVCLALDLLIHRLRHGRSESSTLKPPTGATP